MKDDISGYLNRGKAGRHRKGREADLGKSQRNKRKEGPEMVHHLSGDDHGTAAWYCTSFFGFLLFCLLTWILMPKFLGSLATALCNTRAHKL